MPTKKEVKFKRQWETKAKEEIEEDVVFGKILAKKWSRILDETTFSDLETFLEIKKDYFLLDIGCGPLARAEVQFSLRNLEIIGVDVSATTLKKAKENVRKYGKIGNVDFVLGDAEFLPFTENTFNSLLCIGTISHLPTVESVIKAVKEMKRVTKLNCRSYITWWVNLYSFYGVQNALMLKLLDILKVDRGQVLNFKGISEINDIFNYVGLKIKKMRYGALVNFSGYICYFMPNVVNKILNKIATIFNGFHKSHSLFSSFSNSFEVTCENASPSNLQFVKPDVYYQFF